MTYDTCPHCGAALTVALKWDKVICPFCRGEIIFSAIVPVGKKELMLWSLQQRHEGKK